MRGQLLLTWLAGWLNGCCPGHRSPTTSAALAWPDAFWHCVAPPCRRFKKYAGLDNYPPLQIMFATKGKNKGKLDSHCWYFDAFCYLLQPEYCVLFDAGAC